MSSIPASLMVAFAGRLPTGGRIPAESLQLIKTRGGAIQQMEYAKWLINYQFARHTYRTA